MDVLASGLPLEEQHNQQPPSPPPRWEKMTGRKLFTDSESQP